MCNRFYKNSFCIQQKGKKKIHKLKTKVWTRLFPELVLRRAAHQRLFPSFKVTALRAGGMWLDQSSHVTLDRLLVWRSLTETRFSAAPASGQQQTLICKQHGRNPLTHSVLTLQPSGVTDGGSGALEWPRLWAVTFVPEWSFNSFCILCCCCFSFLLFVVVVFVCAHCPPTLVPLLTPPDPTNCQTPVSANNIQEVTREPGWSPGVRSLSSINPCCHFSIFPSDFLFSCQFLPSVSFLDSALKSDLGDWSAGVQQVFLWKAGVSAGVWGSVFVWWGGQFAGVRC